MDLPKSYLIIRSPRWANEDKTVLSVEIAETIVDDQPVYTKYALLVTTDEHSRYARVIDQIAEDGLTIAEYVDPNETADEVIDAETYDYNESTSKYHLQSCQYCGDTLDLYTIAELAELGATPCAVCNPPKYEGYTETTED